jgi:hypothetical protein
MEHEIMRDFNLEAAIWNLFASFDFFEAAADECDNTVDWFGKLAIARNTACFSRNNQIFDAFKNMGRNFKRGAELARLGDYKLVWDTARWAGSDVRGIMEQPLHSWMNDTEFKEFEDIRVSRITSYAKQITRTLNNGMVKGRSFFDPNPNCPERRNDDDGFPGDSILKIYESNLRYHNKLFFPKVPDPLPEYFTDKTISCKTGDEVPRTGVWYPATGLENHSLTFAMKGMRMQPAFQVIKSVEELKRESLGGIITRPETIAVATIWHPVIPTGRRVIADTNQELRAKAGQPCPKAGIWQPMEPGAAQRHYAANETMVNLGSAYGITVWRWVADR